MGERWPKRRLEDGQAEAGWCTGAEARAWQRLQEGGQTVSVGRLSDLSKNGGVSGGVRPRGGKVPMFR
jgi:hypothetical protein